MKTLARLSAVIFLFVNASMTFAWNNFRHMTVAAIAYKKLTQKPKMNQIRLSKALIK